MKPRIFISKVMHKRLLPRVNGFTYNIYYLALPLSKLSEISQLKRIKYNRKGVLCFREKDYGAKAQFGLESWVKEILRNNNYTSADGEILLITLPCIFGYVFNPVSFYFCFDKAGGLRAVISEVSNTFGEKHIYICGNNNQIIDEDLWMKAEKLFHVSPFLEREGHYQFRFAYKPDKLGIWIDFYDAEGNKKLITSLVGSFDELTDRNLRRVFWKYPLVTFKTIILIHYQAFKLFRKGIKYIVKPLQKEIKMSGNIT